IVHFRSVVHGDLSGANVLIHADGRACISDFGLSTLLTEVGGSTFATSRQAEGTLRWTAPELLNPQVPQSEENPPPIVPMPHSDVYSFGRIVLQILTGKVPYYYYNRDMQVLYAISQGITPQRPSQALVTDRQWSFIQRCWAPLDAVESDPRPCDDDIVEFIRQELHETQRKFPTIVIPAKRKRFMQSPDDSNVSVKRRY
ncbi:kinase-like protein, partial [Paxillus ammoniavirescens]